MTKISKILFEKTKPLPKLNSNSHLTPKYNTRFLSKFIELIKHESSFPFAIRDHQSLRYGNPSGDENERNYAKQVWKH